MGRGPPAQKQQASSEGHQPATAPITHRTLPTGYNLRCYTGNTGLLAHSRGHSGHLTSSTLKSPPAPLDPWKLGPVAAPQEAPAKITGCFGALIPPFEKQASTGRCPSPDPIIHLVLSSAVVGSTRPRSNRVLAWPPWQRSFPAARVTQAQAQARAQPTGPLLLLLLVVVVEL